MIKIILLMLQKIIDDSRKDLIKNMKNVDDYDHISDVAEDHGGL